MAGWIHQKLDQDEGVGRQNSGNGYWHVSTEVN